MLGWILGADCRNSPPRRKILQAANNKRLGKASELVHWLAADTMKVELERSTYDVWHDRAVFHFLTV